jgi:hypothetical protein
MWDNTIDKAMNYTTEVYDKAKNASVEAYDKARDTATKWIDEVSNNPTIDEAKNKTKEIVDRFEEWIKHEFDNGGKLSATAKKALFSEWIDEMFIDEESEAEKVEETPAKITL